MGLQLIEIAAKRINAHFVGSASSGDYQGTVHYLLKKDNLFSIVQYYFGSCSYCDWQMSLESEWTEVNGNSEDIPETVYEPIIKDFCFQAKFLTKNELYANFHMIFGVGVDEQQAELKIRNLIEENDE